jgi:hypothetical protein
VLLRSDGKIWSVGRRVALRGGFRYRFGGPGVQFVSPIAVDGIFKEDGIFVPEKEWGACPTGFFFV